MPALSSEPVEGPKGLSEILRLRRASLWMTISVASYLSCLSPQTFNKTPIRIHLFRMMILVVGRPYIYDPMLFMRRNASRWRSIVDVLDRESIQGKFPAHQFANNYVIVYILGNRAEDCLARSSSSWATLSRLIRISVLMRPFR